MVADFFFIISYLMDLLNFVVLDNKYTLRHKIVCKGPLKKTKVAEDTYDFRGICDTPKSGDSLITHQPAKCL